MVPRTLPNASAAVLDGAKIFAIPLKTLNSPPRAFPSVTTIPTMVSENAVRNAWASS